MDDGGECWFWGLWIFVVDLIFMGEGVLGGRVFMICFG